MRGLPSSFIPWAVCLVVMLSWAPLELVAQPKPTDEVIHFYQARAARDPRDAVSYAKLGWAYAQKTRETGDIRYYEFAEDAFRRALKLGPDPAVTASATTGLAAVALGRHQFREAVGDAEKALGYGATPAVYAIVGDAYVEMGEYDKASDAYTKMLAGPGPPPQSRLWYFRFLRGDPQGAVQELRRAAKALGGPDARREQVAETQAQLGELLFQVGDLPESERAYRDALTHLPGYHSALAGLARVQAAQQRYPEAIKLYEQALAVIPLPEYAVGLGDVYTKSGRPQEAKKQYALVEYIGTLNMIPHTKAIYNRELALFYADHELKLNETQQRAEQELDVRWDVYSYDVLAWALYKNKRLGEARTAMAEALKLGTKDARLLFHAGMIHRALGETERARQYLQQALATNPYFHLLQAEIARRTLRELGGE